MLLRVVVALFLGVSAATAAGASFVVNPIRVTLNPDQRVIALNVTNNGAQPVRVQAQPMRWLVENDADQYVPTDELLVNPPLFTLKPGGAQVLRVGLRSARANDREATYRLYLTEVPGPVGPDFKGLSMTLRLGIPIFVIPAIATSPTLEGALTTDDKGLWLQIRNRGSAHARLLEVVFKDAADQEVGKLPLARDILAEQQRSILLRLDPQWSKATKAHVRVEPESAEFELDLPPPH